jgi:hypothetical protein
MAQASSEAGCLCRVEATQMENLTAKLAKDLHRHEHAVLTTDADSAVDHRIPEFYDIHSGEILDFDLPSTGRIHA